MYLKFLVCLVKEKTKYCVKNDLDYMKTLTNFKICSGSRFRISIYVFYWLDFFNVHLSLDGGKICVNIHVMGVLRTIFRASYYQ
jgi:hypothetical protein